MYAFRKPFTAATYEGVAVFGTDLKTVLVIAQLAGYTISKFIGIPQLSGMRQENRPRMLIVLIVVAELALVGFAFVPPPWKALMLFLNGLPLGMVFGLVLSYLEGRRQTEALSAALCASFIVSSGVVKSVGRALILDWHVTEYAMPMVTGVIFIIPLLISVWILQQTPPPDSGDRSMRADRRPMSASDRRAYFAEYWPGLCLMVLVYVALTIARTMRDDFGVELWRDMGVAKTPSIFAWSEMTVAVVVTAFNAAAIWIRSNRTAIWVTGGVMCASFVLIIVAVSIQSAAAIAPFLFMVTCGIGLYIPYVAFHTTLFERLIAASTRPGNLVFLMYLADAIGYLGYVIVIGWKTCYPNPGVVLPFFRTVLSIIATGSIVSLCIALIYFHRKLDGRSRQLVTGE